MFNCKKVFSHKPSFRHSISLAILYVLGVGDIDDLTANEGELSATAHGDIHFSHGLGDAFFIK